MNSDWVQKNYDKLALIIGAVLAALIAGWLIFQSLGFKEKFVEEPPKRSAEMEATGIDEVRKRTEALSVPVVWKGENLSVSSMVIEVMEGTTPKLKPVEDDQIGPHHPITNQWVKQYSPPLDISRANLKVLDPDSDGFNNLEEFTDKTDPSKSESHPPLIAKVCLVEMVPSKVKVEFKSKVDDRNFQINVTQEVNGGSRFVQMNASFEPKEYRFKLKGFNPKKGVDAAGAPTDKSEAVIEYFQPGEGKTYTVTLVRGQSWDLPTLTAKLKNGINGEEWETRRGQTFQLSNDEKKETFRLIEIGADEAKITDSKGQQRTISKCQ